MCKKGAFTDSGTTGRTPATAPRATRSCTIAGRRSPGRRTSATSTPSGRSGARARRRSGRGSRGVETSHGPAETDALRAPPLTALPSLPHAQRVRSSEYHHFACWRIPAFGVASAPGVSGARGRLGAHYHHLALETRGSGGGRHPSSGTRSRFASVHNITSTHCIICAPAHRPSRPHASSTAALGHGHRRCTPLYHDRMRLCPPLSSTPPNTLASGTLPHIQAPPTAAFRPRGPAQRLNRGPRAPPATGPEEPILTGHDNLCV